MRMVAMKSLTTPPDASAAAHEEVGGREADVRLGERDHAGGGDGAVGHLDRLLRLEARAGFRCRPVTPGSRLVWPARCTARRHASIAVSWRVVAVVDAVGALRQAPFVLEVERVVVRRGSDPDRAALDLQREGAPRVTDLGRIGRLRQQDQSSNGHGGSQDHGYRNAARIIQGCPPTNRDGTKHRAAPLGLVTTERTGTFVFMSESSKSGTDGIVPSETDGNMGIATWRRE